MSEYFVANVKKFYGEKVEIIKEFNVMWLGWECDTDCAIVKIGNEHKIVGTNHGGIQEFGVEFLKDKIAEYEEIALETKNAIQFFNEVKEK